MPLDTRSHQHVLDRAVLAMESGLVVVHDLAARESGQNVLDCLAVDMEFGFMMADILVVVVAEHVEFSLVGPKDDAVRISSVQGNGGALEEVGQLAFAAAQFPFRFATLRDIAKDENHPANG